MGQAERGAPRGSSWGAAVGPGASEAPCHREPVPPLSQAFCCPPTEGGGVGPDAGSVLTPRLSPARGSPAAHTAVLQDTPGCWGLQGGCPP